MRRLASAALAGLLLGACASQGAPPGGPPDVQAPRLVRVVPDTGSTNVRPPRVVFRFDEVVSERPQGGATLDAMFLVSPRDGEPRVEWHREEVSVRPRRGFRPNTVYMVTMLPGLADLRGNVSRDGAQAVFSTGPTIPNTSVRGLAFDWPTARPLTRPFVLAQSVADTSVVYVTYGDSTGIFAFQHLPPGAYRVRAFNDVNANRTLEPREPFDSATVTVAEGTAPDTAARPALELLAFIHDTLGARIQAVTVRDSQTLRVEFDKPVDPTRELDLAAFSLLRPDSSAIRVTDLMTARDAEQRAARREAAARDSIARADSARRALQADSARVANQNNRALPPNIKAPSAPPAPAPGVARDTAPALVPRRPSPQSAFELRLATPLAPDTRYRLRAAGVRNLLGYAATSDRTFTTAKAEKRIGADTAAVAPAVPPAAARDTGTAPRTAPRTPPRTPPRS